MRTHHL